MKKRIKVDSGILSLVILFTGFLYQFPHIYPSSRLWDNILDWLGLIIVLKGTYIRMAARGVKKAHSRQGEGLVKKGLYSAVRNPMYLGSFMIGMGFVLIVWPFWIFPAFAWLFYLRFIRQISREEKWLKKNFGAEYEAYCRTVPQLFPRWDKLWTMKASTLFPWEKTWSTKEVRGLITWPLLAVVLETLQEWRVFGTTHFLHTVMIFSAAVATFFIAMWIRYQEK